MKNGQWTEIKNQKIVIPLANCGNAKEIKFHSQPLGQILLFFFFSFFWNTGV
jgi:hypothetical protein